MSLTQIGAWSMRTGLITTALAVGVTLFAAGLATAQSEPCPTADDVTLQKQLDDAASAGGGTVQLEGRIYRVCESLIIGTNVHLRGMGRGATIIQGMPGPNGKTVKGSIINGTIVAVGTQKSSISNLTLDNATYARDTNGITFVPATNAQQFDGTVASDGVVSDVEIIGAPGIHAYMLWNLRGQHMKFTNNWLDGRDSGEAISNSNQEGIETYGGHDVTVSGNTVANVGGSCINIGSAGDLAPTETVGILAINNHLSKCTVGLSIGTSDEYGGIPNIHTHVSGNVIVSSRLAGILSSVRSSSQERDLDISHNSISGTGGLPSVFAAGILLFCSGPEATVASRDIVGVRVEANNISDVRGPNGHGIRLTGYPNVRVMGNTIADVASEAIFVTNSSGVAIAGNRIERAGYNAIAAQAGGGNISRLLIEQNSIVDCRSGTNGIFLNHATGAAIRNNSFSNADAARTGPIYFIDSCGVTADGNIAWDWPAWQTLASGDCP